MRELLKKYVEVFSNLQNGCKGLLIVSDQPQILNAYQKLMEEVPEGLRN